MAVTVRDHRAWPECLTRVDDADSYKLYVSGALHVVTATRRTACPMYRDGTWKYFALV